MLWAILFRRKRSKCQEKGVIISQGVVMVELTFTFHRSSGPSSYFEITITLMNTSPDSIQEGSTLPGCRRKRLWIGLLSTVPPLPLHKVCSVGDRRAPTMLSTTNNWSVYTLYLHSRFIFAWIAPSQLQKLVISSPWLGTFLSREKGQDIYLIVFGSFRNQTGALTSGRTDNATDLSMALLEDDSGDYWGFEPSKLT